MLAWRFDAGDASKEEELQKNFNQTERIQPGNAHDDVPPSTCGKEPEDNDRTGTIRYVHAPDPCSKYRPPGLADVDAGSLDSVCTRELQFETGTLHIAMQATQVDVCGKLEALWKIAGLFVSQRYDGINAHRAPGGNVACEHGDGA